MVVKQKPTKEEQDKRIAEFFESWNGFVPVPVEDILKKVKHRICLKAIFKPEEYAKLCRYEKKRIRKIGRNLTIMMYLGLPLPSENELRAKVGLLPRGGFKAVAISDSEKEEDDEDWKPWKPSKKNQGVIGVADIIKRQKWLAKKCSVKNEIHDDTIVIPDEFKGEDYTEEPAKSTKTKKNGKTCPKIKPVSAEDRYPKRNLAVVKYRDPKALKDDDFLYCDDCEKLYLGDCTLHGPYVNVEDTEIKMGLADRAKKTCPEGITVGPSGIRKGGLGAWCEKNFKKNTVFGPYEGEAVHRNDVTKLKPLFEGGYAWEIYKNGKLSHYIDGGNVKISNWLRYINCACFEEQQNLISYQYQGKIFYKLYKEAKRGDELLVWYGEQYAKSLGIPTDYKVPIVEPIPLKTERKPFLDKYFECEKCGKVFADEETLLRHRKSKHPVRLSTNKHTCPWCDYSSDIVSHLEDHKRTHTGEQPFKCDVCGKRFTVSSTLQRHTRIHTNERPYQCERCDKRFNVLSSLNRHIRTLHDKIASIVCRECGAKFGEADGLKKHMRTHTGEKPYKCRECGADFARSSSLRVHIITNHTKEFPHRCSICGKGFIAPSEVAKHKNKVH